MSLSALGHCLLFIVNIILIGSGSALLTMDIIEYIKKRNKHKREEVDHLHILK